MSKQTTTPAQEIEPKFHTRESGFKFTQIIIKRLNKNAFIAEFKVKLPNISNPVQTSIYRNSVQDCIKRTAEFLKTELKSEEVTVIL